MSNIALIPSIFLFFGIFSIVYAVALPQFLQVRQRRTVRIWSYGSLIWGSAIILTVFRQELPLLLSYFIANGIALVAYVVHNRALKSLLKEPQGRFNLGLIDTGIFLTSTSALYALDQWIPPEFKDLAKTAFISASVVLASAQGAWYCYQISERYRLRVAQGFAYLYVVVALLWASRIVAAVLVQATHAFDPGIFNTIIWVFLFITGMIKYMVFPLLLLKKNENDKQDQLKQSLARANKTVTSSALSASIAHELNQPLAAIRINSQILLKLLDRPRDRLLNDESLEIKNIVGHILEENERASKIIFTLRSIFIQTPTATEGTDSALLIQRHLELFKKEIEKCEVQVELELVEDAFVRIPQDEFHQLLLNLISNSLQAMSECPVGHRGKLRIQTVRHEGGLQVTVADNGSGVRPEFENSLFEILSTSKDSGMGLGLWLCKYIIERHGGTISYQKSNWGGASFIMVLPCLAIDKVYSASENPPKFDHPIA